MKAFVRIAAENQEVHLADVSQPQTGPNEVLIRVGAFGVGIHDRYFIPATARFPYVIGSEGAGVIAQLGSHVRGFTVGQRVIFTTILQPQGGSWAPYAVAKATALIPLPDNMTFAQGAALPVAGKTALESMRELNLAKGDRLFIAGASGAIGTLVIQLAAALGIRAAASASVANHPYMQALGAEKTVDYNDPAWPQQVRDWAGGGVDAALAIQPGTGAGSIYVVKDGGTLITVSGDNAAVPPQRDIQIRQMGHQEATSQKMAALVQAASAGDIRVVIAQEFPFEKALEALQKTETRRARGKVIVRLDS